MLRTVLFAAAGLVVMLAAIVYGFARRNIITEGLELLPYPWFQVTLIDLYLGFLLFGAWILFRERSRGVAVGWIVVLLLTGNVASCAYVLLAVVRSRGDWRRFWMGARAA